VGISERSIHIDGGTRLTDMKHVVQGRRDPRVLVAADVELLEELRQPTAGVALDGADDEIPQFRERCAAETSQGVGTTVWMRNSL
jgi:hypothetical protein